MKKLVPLFIACVLMSCSEGSLFNKVSEPKEKKEETITLKQRMNAVGVRDYKVTENLEYGENQFQKYDVYQPVFVADTMPSVAMIVIHGGGWSLLDKKFMTPVIDNFKNLKKNVVYFNINHRLAGIGGTTYQDIIDDLDSMIKEVESKKEAYNLSGEIVFYGHSSGGHLALEYSKLRSSNKNIKVVAASSPPTDLTSEKIRNSIRDDKNRILTELLIGATYEEKPSAYKDASPIFKVSSQSKPTILFYGLDDQIITIDQVKEMSNLLTDKKVDNELVTYEQSDHDLGNRIGDITRDIIKFVEER